MPPHPYVELPPTVSKLNNDLLELIYLKSTLGVYDRTVESIRNSNTTPEQLNIQRRSWLQAKSQVASLHRSIVADFSRLPRRMKQSYLYYNHQELKDHGFQPSIERLTIVRPGSRVTIL
ncbi:hypothetical protein N7457_008845 [Penicillium paradoxum]|uniref:uncharacterized protein n=1 Tax=Penicillium paradoxum TaxID=176176 RepID=UPI0025472D96|nr:uncharacterized protein N7457_008845 [Penicillium paradoxum]KAJ5773949.1 hypothetical protein N7457_008845 [Penicillium paradoxum]